MLELALSVLFGLYAVAAACVVYACLWLGGHSEEGLDEDKKE